MKKVPRLILASALVTLVSLVAPAILRADWPPISKQDLEFNSVPGQPDAPAVILLREEIDDDTLNVHQYHARIKILTEAGRKYADVQIPYNRRSFTITDVKGRTTHADGSVVNFEGKPFDKEVVKGQGVRYRVKAFTMPDVQVGSVIEYNYALRYDDNALMPPIWVLQEELFQKHGHYRYTPYRGDVRIKHGNFASGLAWSMVLPKGLELKPFRDRYYDLDFDNMPAFIEEEHMLPEASLKYHVIFYYQSKLDAAGFWKDEGKSWNKDVEKFIDRRDGVAQATQALIAAGDSDEQKLRKIYKFVQGLENRSYLTARSYEERKANGLVPNEGVQDVLRQKSGYRDDITRLFIAMAREARIPAYAMWVADRGEQLFDANLFSTDQLGPEIAIATVDGKEIFLDPGTKYCPFGTLLWRYSASKGLRQNAKGTDLADSANPLVGVDAVKRMASMALSSKGELKGEVALAFFGQEALTRRIAGAQTDAAGRTKMMEDEMRSLLPSNAEVKVTTETAWDDGEQPLVARFQITTPALTNAGKRLLLPLDIFTSNQPARFQHNERKNMVYFHFPFREVDDISIALPPTFTIESVPLSTQAQQTGVAYNVTRSRSGATLTMNRDLQVGGIAFQVSQYADLKGFFAKVKQGDDEQAILKVAGNASGN